MSKWMVYYLLPKRALTVLSIGMLIAATVLMIFSGGVKQNPAGTPA